MTDRRPLLINLGVIEIFAVGGGDRQGVPVVSGAVAGVGFSVTVTALDAANATVTSYTGSVHFTSPDMAAALPSDP